MGDVADKPQILCSMTDCLDHAAVQAAQADRPAAVRFQLLDEGFVDLARQNHLDHFHGLSVGVAQPADKPRFLADLFEHGADLGPAAVNEHHPDTHGGEQDYVLHDGGFQLVADHGVASVFDDDGLARVLFNIRQGLGKNLSPVGGRNVHDTTFIHAES